MHKKNSLLKKLFQIIVGITFFVFCSFSSNAQLIDTTKSTINNQQSTIPKKHSPKKAALMSAALPGLGQIYNKKYWKLPIVYVGLGALAYSINYNQTKYIKYRTAYKYRIDGDAGTMDEFEGKYSESNLGTLTQYYHRYRDLSVIGTAALYLLNIVDASVDAHLFTFDVSEDLSLIFHPALINTACAKGYTSGIALIIKL